MSTPWRTLLFLLAAATAVAAQAPPRRGEAPLSREALDRVRKATVFIESRYRPLGSDPAKIGEDDIAIYNGSGFVVDPGGLIITNDHVVSSFMHLEDEEEPASGRRAADDQNLMLDSFSVRVCSGTEETRVYPAEVLVTHPFPDDIALIRIRPDAPLTPIDGLDPANRTSLNNMTDVTDRVWAVGFPRGAGMEDELEHYKMTRNPHGPDVSVREGQITALRKDEKGKIKVVEHSCNIEHGNSGGPLVDSGGLLVGIISLGTDRTAFAIPLDTVLDRFFDTLACHGYGNLFETPSKRIITVDPPSGETDPLGAALKAAQNGDEIILPAAEFHLAANLPLRTGIRLRGAGIGRTVLRAKKVEDYAVTIGGARFVEISNLTIVNENGNGVWFAGKSGAEQYLHDVEIRAGGCGLGFGAGSRGRVTHCIVEGDMWIEGKESQPRIERVTLRQGVLSRRDRASVTVRDGAIPQLVGCRIAAPATAVRVEGASKVRMYGCEIAAGAPAAVSIPGGSAEIEACWIHDPFGPGLLLEQKAAADVCATEILTGSAPAISASGSGTRVGISDAILESLGVAVRVESGATATLTSSAVLHDANRSTTLPWSDAPSYAPVAAAAGPVARARGTPEEEARWEESERRRRALIPYGVVIAGADSRAEGSGNLFLTNGGGTAVQEEAGAMWTDRGGNETTGAAHEHSRAADDR